MKLSTQPTKRQAEVLAFMRSYYDDHSRAPTMRQICSHFGWASTNSAAHVLGYLKRKGLVRHAPNTFRGWRAA